MDGQRFDELTRALAKGTNRRGAIKVLAGGLAGALLGIGGGRSGAAKPDKCPPSKVCGTACCPDGYYCVNGACTTDVPAVVPEDTGKGGAACAAGHKRCASQCVNLASDVNNCGTCGNNCATVANATTVCNGGVCDYVCNAPFDDCNGSAADGCETNLTKTSTTAARARTAVRPTSRPTPSWAAASTGGASTSATLALLSATEAR